jgi:hypothetical protein
MCRCYIGDESKLSRKVKYNLWTDGRGSFAVGKPHSQVFEYSDTQQFYNKIIDSKLLNDGSITEELVQDWIEELREAEILDDDGNIIVDELL